MGIGVGRAHVALAPAAEDFDMAETDHLKSISHSHCPLPPKCEPLKRRGQASHTSCFRTKRPCASSRRRTLGGVWQAFGLAVGFAVPRGEKSPASRFGAPARKAGTRKSPTQRVPRQSPPSSPPDSAASGQAARPARNTTSSSYFHIGVQLNGLVPDRLHSLNLFDGTEA